ncbi:MAG: sugar nucleotide-binding protein, partial [Myxococcales bacterium]
GRSKVEAEQRVLDLHDRPLVIRTGAFFGPWDLANFVSAVVSTLARGEPFFAPSEQVVSPTYVPDLVNATLDLLIDGERGVWHLTNEQPIAWDALARLTATMTHLDAGLVAGRSFAALGMRAPRPRYSALLSRHGPRLPTLEDALGRFVAECEHRPWESPSGRSTCGVCGGTTDASDGHGRCGIHR